MGPQLPWGPSHPHSAQASPQHTPLHLSSPRLTISLLDCGIPPYSSCLGLKPPSHAERGPPDLHHTLLKKKAKAWARLRASSWTSQESSTGCSFQCTSPFHLLSLLVPMKRFTHPCCLLSFLLKLPSHPLLTICSLSAPPTGTY